MLGSSENQESSGSAELSPAPIELAFWIICNFCNCEYKKDSKFFLMKCEHICCDNCYRKRKSLTEAGRCSLCKEDEEEEAAFLPFTNLPETLKNVFLCNLFEGLEEKLSGWNFQLKHKNLQYQETLKLLARISKATAEYNKYESYKKKMQPQVEAARKRRVDYQQKLLKEFNEMTIERKKSHKSSRIPVQTSNFIQHRNKSVSFQTPTTMTSPVSESDQSTPIKSIDAKENSPHKSILKSNRENPTSAEIKLINRQERESHGSSQHHGKSVETQNHHHNKQTHLRVPQQHTTSTDHKQQRSKQLNDYVKQHREQSSNLQLHNRPSERSPSRKTSTSNLQHQVHQPPNGQITSHSYIKTKYLSNGIKLLTESGEKKKSSKFKPIHIDVKSQPSQIQNCREAYSSPVRLVYGKK